MFLLNIKYYELIFMVPIYLHHSEFVYCAKTGLNETIQLSNFEENFLRRLNTMRKENRRCNVTITVKNKVFTCHDIVLVTASSYFETMLNGNFKESNYHENITLNEIEPEAFEEILSAIYTCKFHLHQGNAYFIVKACHMLQLNDILEASINCIMQNINIDYLIETCSFLVKRTR